MSPRILRQKGTKTYVTWATARRKGAARHVDRWETLPGWFISVDDGVGHTLRDANDATEDFLNGAAIIASPDIAWVGDRFRPLSSLKLTIPKTFKGDLEDAIATREAVLTLRDRVLRYETWMQYLNDAQTKKQTFPAGTILFVRTLLELDWNYTSSWGTTTTEGTKRIAWVFITPTRMTTEEVGAAVATLWKELHSQENNYAGVQVTATEVSAEPTTITTLGEHPLKQLKWFYSDIPDTVEHPEPEQCLIDYLMLEIGVTGRNSNARLVTRAALLSELGPHPTTNKVMDYVRRFKIISAYCVGPTLQVYDYHIAEEKTRATLVFINNNGHCYPVTDEAQRKCVIERKHIDFGQLNSEVYNDATTAVYDTDLNLKTKDDTTNINIVNKILEWIESLPTTTTVAIVTIYCLSGVCSELINRTNVMPQLFKTANGCLTAFKHPTRNLTLLAGPEYHERKTMCDAFYEINKDADFLWRNQSWGVIGMNIMESCYARVTTAEYSDDARRIFEHSQLRAYIAWCGGTCDGSETAIDQRRSYTSILMHAEQPWALGQYFDSIRVFNEVCVGEHLLTKDLVMGRGTIRLVAGWYPHQVVKYAIENGYITTDDISHSLPASTALPSTFFKRFATDMYEKYPTAKNLVNAMIGCLGILHSKNQRCGVTSDMDLAVSVVMNARAKPNHDAEIIVPNVCNENTYFVTETKKCVRTQGHLPLYRQVIAMSYINLDKQVNAVCLPETTIMGYNTDCIKIRGPYNEAAVKEKETCAPGEYHVETKPIKPYGPHPSEFETKPFDIVPLKATVILPESELVAHILAGGSAVVTGIAGAGKTELARTVSKAFGGEVLGTAVSNKACENLKERGITSRNLFALLSNPATKMLSTDRLAGVKLFIVDECYTVPPTVMATLARGKEIYGFQVLLLGDSAQTTAICDAPIDYVNNDIFMKFAGNTRVECTYKGFEFPEKARYTPDLYHALDYFQRNSVIAPEMRKDTLPDAMRHLTYTNERRKAVNISCLARWCKRHNKRLIKIGELMLASGLELMAYHGTDHERNIYKTNTFTVASLTATTVKLRDAERTIEMEWKDVNAMFDYAFATTVHKYQGGKITEPFIIHEVSKMDKELLYTAMSRGTKLADVHLADVEDWGQVYKAHKFAEHQLLGKSIKREECRIYRITFPSGKSYVGRTGGNLEDRLAQHRAYPTNAAMAAELATGGSIEEMLMFTYRQKKTADDIESEWIAREIEARGADAVLNAKQLPKAILTERPTTRKGKEKILKPSEDKSKRRYEVRWLCDYIPKEHRVKRFSYATREKEEAFSEAQAWAAELVKTYT